MSIQRVVLKSGAVRYKVRIKSHGHEVTTRQFSRKADAVAWEAEQAAQLRTGDWVDPRRGRVRLVLVAEGWLVGRGGVKRRTRETDELNWNAYIKGPFGQRPVASITSAQVTEWAARLVSSGRAPATARRALATFRSILDHAVADGRLIRNPAAAVKAPRGRAAREGQALTPNEVELLRLACRGRYADLIVMLAHTGLRWGELAGLQVGDRIAVPGPGLRVQRAILSSGTTGELFEDTPKAHTTRTVPLTPESALIVDRWAQDRPASAWLFPSTVGTPLGERSWKRMINWPAAKQAIGRPTLRVHDLRHTAASLWIGSGADVKVVQRVLGHASATMTLNLYGHLMDANLWATAAQFGDRLGIVEPEGKRDDQAQ